VVVAVVVALVLEPLGEEPLQQVAGPEIDVVVLVVALLVMEPLILAAVAVVLEPAVALVVPAL
jgi:hypothetical protein